MSVQQEVPSKASGSEQDTSKLIAFEDASTLEQLGFICAGGLVVTLREEDARALSLPVDGDTCDRGGCLTSEAPLALSCWRTRATVNVLVSRADCEQMAEKLKMAQAAAAVTDGPESKRQKVA